MGFRRVILLGYGTIGYRRILATGENHAKPMSETDSAYSKTYESTVFALFHGKNFWPKNIKEGVAAPWYVGKNFSWKSAKTVNS